MKIALNRDDFYMHGDLMEESGMSYTDNVICTVSNEWYLLNKDKLPTNFEVIESGTDLIIKNANKA